jgi:hypothetical protein
VSGRSPVLNWVVSTGPSLNVTIICPALVMVKSAVLKELPGKKFEDRDRINPEEFHHLLPIFEVSTCICTEMD